MSFSDDDDHMALALRLAERGRGQTSPNPMVGAVVVADSGVRIGLGYHARAGEPHAEINALAMAGDRARGATLYCTLEPCSHTGRTGPCCVAVAAAGIRRVVVAMRDPNPLVQGRGAAYLVERGIEVTEGVLSEAAERLNAPFVTAMRRGRPWVLLKAATSLDGCVAAAPGRRTQLTSAEANRVVHRFRAEVDAIAVGSGTMVADDPRLTARGVYRDRPLVRVVFDSRLRTPPAATLLRTLDSGPVWIVTTEQAGEAHADRAAALRDAGAELLFAGRHDLGGALREMASRGVRSIVVEGGPTLQRACWNAGVVDRVQLFIAPLVVGAGGLAWSMPDSFSVAALARPRVRPLGPDVMVEGDVHRFD